MPDFNQRLTRRRKIIMFIKFGKEQHLRSLMDRGEIWFNPSIKFRTWEKNEGVKDKNDGGIRTKCEKTKIFDYEGHSLYLGEGNISYIIQPAKQTPVFCLFQTEEILLDIINDIKREFPSYNYALIIEDEMEFLENIRFSFRNKAFCHNVFYQDEINLDYNEFLFNGQSDVRFYEPKKKNRYYAYIENKDSNGTVRHIFIDDSNFYRTMFKKGSNYKSQREYRIVLPFERIEQGKIYKIKPFKAVLVNIDDLVDKNY